MLPAAHAVGEGVGGRTWSWQLHVISAAGCVVELAMLPWRDSRHPVTAAAAPCCSRPRTCRAVPLPDLARPRCCRISRPASGMACAAAHRSAQQEGAPAAGHHAMRTAPAVPAASCPAGPCSCSNCQIWPELLHTIQDEEAASFIMRCLEPAGLRPTAAELLEDPFLHR